MIRNAIVCASLLGILALNLSLASAEDAKAKQAAYQAMFDQTAAHDLNDIGNLQLTLTGSNFVFNNPSPSSPVEAAFRFPGDLGTTALPEGKPVELPPNVNMFIVEFKWQPGEGPLICRPTSKDGGGDLCDYKQQKTWTQKQTANGDNLCCIVVVFARELLDGRNRLIPAFILTETEMLVSEALLIKAQDPSNPSYSINGVGLEQLARQYQAQRLASDPSRTPLTTLALRSGWASVIDYHFERYPGTESCRPYGDDGSKDAIDTRRPEYDPPDLGKDNGIIPFPPKVYDVFTLRQMLAQTASQLSTLSGFNPANITAALGTLQGVTSSSSFFNAQVTTSPTPSVVSTVNNPSTGTVTTTPASGSSSTSTTATCPAGFLPTIGSGNAVTCIAVTGTTSNPVTIATTTTPAGNTNPLAGAQTVVTQNPLTQQTVTTNPSFSGTVPAALASTAFANPTNIGESASDLLTDQVQLNAQITSLQLALQGALSDQFLIKAGKTIAARQQTTLGFNIDLHPLPRYRHAVAEVRIWVFPARLSDEVSVVNLLPAAKTYNVAKITSKQNQFGAGVVVNPVNIGVAGGKTKNRLYIAKDTDTLALQYFANKDDHRGDSWPKGAERIGRSPQERLFVDLPRQIEAWQTVKSFCDSDPGPDRIHVGQEQAEKLPNPLVFGWQFRPVLGADYVQGGIRPVFAQLALPVSLGTQYAPHVFIQTLWRDYDEKKQVAGAVYSGSCSIIEETDPIEMVSPLKVHSVDVADMGGGVLKVSAGGEFLAQGFSVLSGQSTIGPATFDGTRIQIFGNAASLLTTDDLKLVAEDGKITNLSMKPNFEDACNITDATLHAIPRPDGNSWIEATINSGPRFNLTEDKAPKPLFLIGSQVYGLHETPFLEAGDHACAQKPAVGGIICTYHFLASTDVLRAAESYTVRDLAWDRFKYTDKIRFAPTFTALALLATNPPATPDTSAPSKCPTEVCSPGKLAAAKPATPSKPAALPPVYTLTGTDFQNFRTSVNWNCPASFFNCIEVYQGLTKFTLTQNNFQVTSRTVAAITFAPASDNSTLTATPRISLVVPNRTIASINDTSAGAVIFYTVDGNTPSTESSATNHYYTRPFSLAHGPPITTIKAIAISDGHIPSAVAVAQVIPDPTDASKFITIQLPTSTGTASQPTYKAYRFIWYTAKGEPVEWDLPVPQETPVAVTASAILNQSDSTEITFGNVQVLANSPTLPITFTFDGNVLTSPSPVFKYDPAAQTVKILITSSMTAKPGHKELLLNGYTMAPGTGTPKAVQIELPFDVTKR